MDTHVRGPKEPRSRVRRPWRFGIAVAVGSAAALHVSATALYLLPKNPLSNLYAPMVQAYMTPLFEQNWHLFSPNPVTRTERVIVKCHGAAGTVSGWLEPSQPALEAHARLLGVTGASYVLRNYVGLAREVSEAVDAGVEACGKNPGCAARVPVRLLAEPRFAHLRRYATQACSAWSPAAARAEVQLASLPAKAFSKRHEAAPSPVSRLSLGMFDFGGGG